MNKVFLFLVLSAFPNTVLFVEGGPNLSDLTQSVARRGVYSLSESIPALSVWEDRRGRCSSRKSVEVAVKRKRPLDLKQKIADEGGFYYGITEDTLTKASNSPTEKRMSLSDSMSKALEELITMRQEMEKMRSEMQTLRWKLMMDGDLEEDSEEKRERDMMLKRKRGKEADSLSKEIESWAKEVMLETDEDGWKNVECSKMMRKSLNPDGLTKASIKWMKDSRGDKAKKNDENEYPCIRCSSTIDAPIEDVCTYLSQESALPDYNDLVVEYKDVEDISPNAKICASWTPQILFIKRREFVTFCHHRWKKDGSEVIVSQAWSHDDYPETKDESSANACRAYALRGANIISRCPDDADKTIIEMISHADPGGNVPAWACKTAVKALVPVEPFKIFQKINKNVKQNLPQLRERLEAAEMVSSPSGRSSRPAGIAQLGYACFWPKGGGSVEGEQRAIVDQCEDRLGSALLDQNVQGDETEESEGY